MMIDVEDQHVRSYLSRTIFIASAVVSSISFLAIFNFKFDLQGSFGFSELSVFSLPQIWGVVTAPGYWSARAEFFQSQGFAIFFFLVAYFWYHLYLYVVQNELGIMSTLFSKMNPPSDPNALENRDNIGLLALVLTLCFLGLAIFCDQPAVYIAILLALNLSDGLGNAKINRTLDRFLSDPRLEPSPAEASTPFILRRREIARAHIGSGGRM